MIYPKIENLFIRDRSTGIMIDGEWRQPAVRQLQDMRWNWHEKLDGTNVRIQWFGGRCIDVRGRTKKSQLPPELVNNIQKRSIDIALALENLLGRDPEFAVTVYGEGVGPKIQKNGAAYSQECTFVPFDISSGGGFRDASTLAAFADMSGFRQAPLVMAGTIQEARSVVLDGFSSHYVQGARAAEGLVGRLDPSLRTEGGSRLIVKLKTADLRRM